MVNVGRAPCYPNAEWPCLGVWGAWGALDSPKAVGRPLKVRVVQTLIIYRGIQAAEAFTFPVILLVFTSCF